MDAKTYFSIVCIVVILLPVAGYLFTRAVGKAVIKTALDGLVIYFNLLVETTKANIKAQSLATKEENDGTKKAEKQTQSEKDFNEVQSKETGKEKGK